MHYQHLLLPALAGLVVANNNGWDEPVSDALPLEELRDIPVLSRNGETGIALQDISPLAMAANENDNSGSNIKRTPSADAHQLQKRAACDPQPTLPNTYNINLANAQAFRSDSSAASVANNANPAPTGYYQTFKNLQGSSNAMSPSAPPSSTQPKATTSTSAPPNAPPNPAASLSTSSSSAAQLSPQAATAPAPQPSPTSNAPSGAPLSIQQPPPTAAAEPTSSTPPSPAATITTRTNSAAPSKAGNLKTSTPPS